MSTAIPERPDPDAGGDTPGGFTPPGGFAPAGGYAPPGAEHRAVPEHPTPPEHPIPPEHPAFPESQAGPAPSAVPPGTPAPAFPPGTPPPAFPPPSPFAAQSGPFGAPSGPYSPYGPSTPAGGHSIDGYSVDGRTFDGRMPDGQAQGGPGFGGPGFGGQPTDPTGLGPIPGPWPQYEPPTPKGPLDSVAARSLVALGVGVVVALLGFPLGWLWESVVPRVPVVRQGQEFFYADPYGEQRAAQEGWFILLSIGVGILLAILCWVLLRRFRGAPIAVALGLGGTVAGWLTWRFGHAIGYAHNLALQRAAKDGQTVFLPPDLRVRQKGDIAFWHHLPYISGDLLYLGIAALTVYLLFVAFTAHPDLRPRRRLRGPQAPPTPEAPSVS